MAQPSKLDNAGLAMFASQLATLLGGTDLNSIDSNVRADLATAMGTLPDTLSTAVGTVASNKNEWRQDAALGKTTRKAVLVILQQVKKALDAGNAPDDQYVLCGFDPPVISAGAVIPNDPSDLAGTGSSNGVNSLTWTGNNSGRKVTYQIFQRTGTTVAFSMVGTSSKQKFSHPGQTPGVYSEYKVRAAAAQAISNFSNSAVVYA